MGKFFNLAHTPMASTLKDKEDQYWYNIDHYDEGDKKNTLHTLPDDVPYLCRYPSDFIWYQPIDAKVLKTTSGIRVKEALLINEQKRISTIMDEVNK